MFSARISSSIRLDTTRYKRGSAECASWSPGDFFIDRFVSGKSV
jgi:hypothetical protein